VTYAIGVSGIPRTKKTSNQGVVIPGKAGKKPRAIMFPAAEWREWVKVAHIFINGVTLVAVKKSTPRLVPLASEPQLWTSLEVPMNCAATFYLGNRQHGDLLGYLQGLADLLAERQVIANDRYLARFDACRLVHDGSTPRVELLLSPLPLELE